MTSSGSCIVCGKPAFEFHYTKEWVLGQPHEGFWFCPDHNPTKTVTPTVGSNYDYDLTSTDTTNTNVVLDGPKLSRRERRALMRKNK